MTVAALDLAATTGFSVIADNRLVTYGHQPLITCEQVEALADVIASYAPSVVAIEATYVAVNASTAIKLAVLRGRVVQALERRGLATELVQPSTWRKTTIAPPPRSKRKLLKQLAQRYVSERFSVSATEDEADAICLATHMVDRISLPLSALK